MYDLESIGNYIEELRSRYGKVVEVEDVQDKDMITANLTELNDDQSVKEGGINQTINFFMPRISNADAKAKLVGLKKGDKVVVNAKTLTDSITDSARTLGLTAEQLENASDNFEITIQSSSRMGLADLNQELFDKVFGEGNVKNEEEFNTKIQEDAVKFLKGHGANKFKNDLIDLLVDTVKFDLPNEFLQKWLVAASEGKTSQEEVQKDYDKYAKTFRWQLIEGAIVKDTKIAGVIATNTTISREGLQSENKSEMGGLSGKPLTKRSTEVIRFLSEKSNKAFPIIGVGGIHTAKDALEKLEAGASLVQLYTGFIYEGPKLIKDINKALLKK